MSLAKFRGHTKLSTLLVCSLYLMLLCRSACGAEPETIKQTRSDELFSQERADFYTTPGSIRQQQGKWPATTTLILWKKVCVEGDQDHLDVNGEYQISIAGPGLHLDAPFIVSSCKLQTNLTIDQAAASSGYFVISVLKKSSVKPFLIDKGVAVLALLDSATAPIPSSPQVDVIWSVLSKQLCKDNFGNHVAANLYCIEVKIGNNTGHQLQLAGVGFKSTRYTLPVCTFNKPKPGDQRQQSPEKGEDCKSVVFDSGIVDAANISYQSVRASAQAFEFLNARNILVNSAAATGILMAAFNPFFHATYSVARWTAGTSVVGSALPAAVGRVAGDSTLRELNNLDDQAFRDGKAIPNNTQIRTMVFVDKKTFNGYFGQQMWTTACKNAGLQCNTKRWFEDPIAVKLALGKLVVIGDEIDFIQRVVVDSNVTSQEVSLPVAQIQNAKIDSTARTVEVTLNAMADRQTIVSAYILTGNDPSTAKPLSLKSSNDGTVVYGLGDNALDASKNYQIQLNLKSGETLTKSNVSVSK